MKTSNFTHIGGLKGTQNRLDFMQQGYIEALAAVAKLCGDKTIICGVEVDASNNVSDGWIAVDGELIRFIGGSIAAQIVFNTEVTPLVFADGSINNVHFDKTATCGSVGSFSFTELQPLITLKNVWKKDDLRMCIKSNEYITQNFDTITGKGITTQESGWQILTKAYPSASGKAFVNIDNDKVELNEAGKILGNYESLIGQQNLPNVRLSIFSDQVNTQNGNLPQPDTFVTRSGINGAHSYEMRKGDIEPTLGLTSKLGDGVKFNVTQPSFVVLTLIKL